MLLTYQDFEEYKQRGDTSGFIRIAIENHRASPMFADAITADAYDHQRNVTIHEYVQRIFTIAGEPIEDFTASNNKSRAISSIALTRRGAHIRSETVYLSRTTASRRSWGLTSTRSSGTSASRR